MYLEKPQLSEYDLVNQAEDLSIDEYTKRRYKAKKVLHETLQKHQEQADAVLRKQSQPKVLAPEISEDFFDGIQQRLNVRKCLRWDPLK